MTNFLVFEIQVWLFLLLLVIVLGGLAVGAWFGWRYLQRREAALRESIETAAAEDSMTKRNRMLIRLDHELKNPLTALRTSAASIREVVRDGGTLSEVEPAAKQVDVSSRRVARLLADLRKLADVETRIIEYARVDLDALIHQAVEDASTAPGAEDRMIVATVARAPWRLPDVAGEEDLLLTAILNLLGNALKYSSQAEVVELRANEQIIDGHRWVVVEVADTGSGIPLAEQENVWDELSRGSRVRAVAGSGMGLSLVRAIVTRHGGSVQLFSQEGVGTSVRMVLPVLADAAPVTVPQMSDHMDRVAAGSHAVQPVQQADSRQAPGFLPPRQPNEAELQGRILGTPRRTSKRRLERVDGNLVNRRTGESVSGGFPPDSGQHSQFKPPRQAPNAGGQNPGYGQPPAGSQPNSGPQRSGPQQPGQPSVGSQPHSGQQSFGQPPVGSQPNSGPQNFGQPYAGSQPNSGPQNFGQQPVGSQPGAPYNGQPPAGSQPAGGLQPTGQPPVGSQPTGQPGSGPQMPQHGYGPAQPNQNGPEAGYPDRRRRGDQQ
ncbi:sensor histidine kinase [Brevibacterium sediminis]|uniref:histidine kinase n=1 Tax=Brevibacterium sediminis TaxID=1857024 RepID=A0A5C4X2N9_9MICO|nr:HAMP domain-containing sensor histidine kinase [Brevibacterium sediminis]TNM53985.1 histidine kinase [Brevibacterium sediminis]